MAKNWGKYTFVLFWENIALKDYKPRGQAEIHEDRGLRKTVWGIVMCTPLPHVICSPIYYYLNKEPYKFSHPFM